MRTSRHLRRFRSPVLKARKAAAPKIRANLIGTRKADCKSGVSNLRNSNERDRLARLLMGHLDTTTGTWQQLTSAPKPHWGSGLYLDGGLIRDARDRKLNYHIETDTWSKKACRADLLVNHCQSANIASAHLPF